jgi:hypothetical protein
MSLDETPVALEIETCELRLYTNMPTGKREDDSMNYSIEYFRCFNCNGKNKDCQAYKPAYNNQNVI